MDDLFDVTFGRVLADLPSVGCPVTIGSDLLGLTVGSGGEVLHRVVEGTLGHDVWSGGVLAAHVHQDAGGVMHVYDRFHSEVFQTHAHADGSFSFQDGAGMHLGSAHHVGDSLQFHDPMHLPVAELAPVDAFHHLQHLPGVGLAHAGLDLHALDVPDFSLHHAAAFDLGFDPTDLHGLADFDPSWVDF
jgi:hypothetical protein